MRFIKTLFVNIKDNYLLLFNSFSLFLNSILGYLSIFSSKQRGLLIKLFSFVLKFIYNLLFYLCIYPIDRYIELILYQKIRNEKLYINRQLLFSFLPNSIYNEYYNYNYSTYVWRFERIPYRWIYIISAYKKDSNTSFYINREIIEATRKEMHELFMNSLTKILLNLTEVYRSINKKKNYLEDYLNNKKVNNYYLVLMFMKFIIFITIEIWLLLYICIITILLKLVVVKDHISELAYYPIQQSILRSQEYGELTNMYYDKSRTLMYNEYEYNVKLDEYISTELKYYYKHYDYLPNTYLLNYNIVNKNYITSFYDNFYKRLGIDSLDSNKHLYNRRNVRFQKYIKMFMSKYYNEKLGAFIEADHLKQSNFNFLYNKKETFINKYIYYVYNKEKKLYKVLLYITNFKMINKIKNLILNYKENRLKNQRTKNIIIDKLAHEYGWWLFLIWIIIILDYLTYITF